MSIQFAPAAVAASAKANLPQSYENARLALSECVRVDECKGWADKAAALASYAKQAEDTELEKMAGRIRARAMRRAGELLKQIEPASGGDRGGGRGNQGEGSRPLVSRKEAARSAGLSDHQQKTAIRVANVPEQSFNEQVESDNPPTVTTLAEQGRKPRQAPPDPQTWLKGRDPNAFNKVMHLIGDMERYARELAAADIDLIASNLDDDQTKRARAAIAAIDAAHDRIITRI